MAKKVHPDKNPDDPEANEKVKLGSLERLYRLKESERERERERERGRERERDREREREGEREI